MASEAIRERLADAEGIVFEGEQLFVILSPPLRVGGETLERMRLREAKLGMPPPRHEKDTPRFALMQAFGLTAAQYGALRVRDVRRAIRVLEAFAENRPQNRRTRRGG